MLVQAAASIRLRIGRVPVLRGCVWFEHRQVDTQYRAIYLAFVDSRSFRRWWRRRWRGGSARRCDAASRDPARCVGVPVRGVADSPSVLPLTGVTVSTR